jgi:LPPG:FO 2-phospho-L-lactate transferase
MKIVALAGGVGGAKLADGLTQVLSPDDLTIIVNTGDDFQHLGLTICPDIDTVCYTLAGLSNPETGWGRLDDTFHVLENIKTLGGPGWFRVGDKDLATHIERTRRLHSGQTLSQVTRSFCEDWGVQYLVLPMSNQPVYTMVKTLEFGELQFQEYFVHQNCVPKVTGFRFSEIESALPSPGVLDAIVTADAVILCPSNPWVSIDPILAIPGIRSSIKKKTTVAVSPIIGGHTVKGPAAKMFFELGIQPSALSVAQHYKDILSGFVLDNIDAGAENYLSIPVSVTQTLMKSRGDRGILAQDVLDFIQKIHECDQ